MAANNIWPVLTLAEMLNNSKTTVLTATLVATLMLSSSGCISMGSDFFCDDRPYQGTKFSIVIIRDFLSGERGEEASPSAVACILCTIDLPFTFALDTARLPFDLIEISKYPQFRGRVLHGTTGKAVSGVVVKAAAEIVEGGSSRTQDEWRKEWRKKLGWGYRLTSFYSDVHRIGNREYGFVAPTRTNNKGEFVFKLDERIDIEGFVAFKKGYKDAAWQQSDGYQDVEVPTLYLIPEAD